MMSHEPTDLVADVVPVVPNERDVRIARHKSSERRNKWIGRVVAAVVFGAAVFGAWQWLKPFDYFIDREIDVERTAEAIEFLDGHHPLEAGRGVNDTRTDRDAYVLGTIAAEARVDGKRLDLLAISLHLLDHVEDDADRAAIDGYIRAEFEELVNPDRPRERRYRDTTSDGQYRWSRFLMVAALSAAHDAETASLLAGGANDRRWAVMSNELDYVVDQGSRSYDLGVRSLVALWNEGKDLPLYSDRPINAALTLEEVTGIRPRGSAARYNVPGDVHGEVAADGTRLDMRAIALDLIQGYDDEKRKTFYELIDSHLAMAPDQSSGFTDERLSIEQRVHEEILIATIAYAVESDQATAAVLAWLDSPAASQGLGAIRLDDTAMGQQIRSVQAHMSRDHDFWTGVL